MRSKLLRVALVVVITVITFGIAWAFSAGQGMSFTATNADTTEIFFTSTCPANSNQLMTQSQFQTNYNHTGTCGSGSTTQIVDYTTAMACKSGGGGGTVHTPIIANPSFASASFASWSADSAVYTGACTASSAFAGSATPDNDSDSGSAVGGTGNGATSCFNSDATSVVVGLAQTFSIVGTPTSQSVSFVYNAPSVTAGGSGGCASDTGSVGNLILKVNGTTVSTTTSPTVDGAWHTVSASTTALINGSNTIDITVSLAGAHGYNFNVPTSDCSTNVRTAQTFAVDKVAVTATY